MKKNKNKKIILGCLVIVIAICVLAALAYGLRVWPFAKSGDTQKQREDSTTKSAKEKVASDKKNTKSGSKSGGSASSPVSPDNQTPGAVPTNPSIGLSLADFRQANGIVYSTVQIQNSASSGTCVFNYTTPESRPVVQEVISTSSQCVSNIPEVQFDKTGSWKLHVIFYTQNTKAELLNDVTIH